MTPSVATLKHYLARGVANGAPAFRRLRAERPAPPGGDRRPGQPHGPWREWYWPANVITELRLVAVPLIAVVVMERRFGWALGLFIGAALSDGVDGWLARHFDQRSALGSYLDPLADKLLLITLFALLALDATLPWGLSILVFVRDACILTTVLVLYWRTQFRDFRPTWWGKASTTAELATVGVALLEALTLNRYVMRVETFGWFAVTVLATASGIHYAFTGARRYHAQQA